MSCPHQRKILPFILGELPENEKNDLLQHLDHCPGCKKLYDGYLFSGDLLRKRAFPRMPRNLEKECIRAVRTVSIHREYQSNLRFTPRLFWRGAMAFGIFLIGLGAGKLLFDTPDSLRNWTRGIRMIRSDLAESGSIKTHLVSVEAFLLALTNAKQDVQTRNLLIDTSHIQALLEKTRKYRTAAKDSGTELFNLLTDIERVLDEILMTIEYGQMDLDSINESIQEQNLLPKIHSRTA